jgi:hypothetical protein
MAATEPGLKAAYIEGLGKEIEARRGELDGVKEQLAVAKFEDDAEARLSADDRAVLVAAGILDRDDVAALNARRVQLTDEIRALRALAEAAEQAA